MSAGNSAEKSYETKSEDVWTTVLNGTRTTAAEKSHFYHCFNNDSCAPSYGSKLPSIISYKLPVITFLKEN